MTSPVSHSALRICSLAFALRRALLCCGIVLLAHAQTADAQQAGTPGWNTSTEQKRPSAPAQPGAPANTTVVPRSAPDSAADAAKIDATLIAVLTDDGTRIEQGMIWRVYQDGDPAKTAAPPRLISSHKEASPVLRLARGAYIVNVAFGRAHLTKRITIAGDKPQQEKFVLNAGGLRVTATLANGEKAPDTAVSYDIISGETDQSGSKAKVLSGAKPGLVVRLNAGIYQLASTYGDANAVVRADVTVEAGKLTEATVIHHGVKVTFKLVNRSGGEALADTQWAIHTQNGELIRESSGALPTHILAAGRYVVSAKQSSSARIYKRDFVVESGDAAQVEVIAQ